MRETTAATTMTDHIDIWLKVYYESIGPTYLFLGYLALGYVQHRAVCDQSKKTRSEGLTTADPWTD